MAQKIQFPSKLEHILFHSTKRIRFLEGGRGGAKSHSIARRLLVQYMQEKRRCLCTREVQKSISQSVYQLLVDVIIKYKLPYTYNKEKIQCTRTGSEFIFAGLLGHTVDSIKSYEGVDDCWIEEGQTVSKYSLNILIPTIRKEGSVIWVSMNRTEELDPIFEMFVLAKRNDVEHIKINWYEHQFNSQDFINEALQFKENFPDDYTHVYEGEPIAQSDKAVLGLKSLQEATNRAIKLEGAVELGIDVARFGDDTTVITARRGLKAYPQREYTKLRTFEVAEKAIEFMNDIKNDNEDIKTFAIKVDDTGVGGGVTDDLIRQGFQSVQPINNNQKAKDSDKYDSAITEMYFEMREIIKEVSMPDDQMLRRELSTRRYGYDTKGRRKIESKDEYKKRYKSSPDKADSFLLCFYSYYHNISLSFF